MVRFHFHKRLRFPMTRPAHPVMGVTTSEGTW